MTNTKFTYAGKGFLNSIITFFICSSFFLIFLYIGYKIPIPQIKIIFYLLNFIFVIVTCILFFINNSNYFKSKANILFQTMIIKSTGALIDDNSTPLFPYYNNNNIIFSSIDLINGDNFLLFLQYYLNPINNNSYSKNEYIKINDGTHEFKNKQFKNKEEYALFYYNTIISIICNNYLNENNHLNEPDDKNIYKDYEINNAILAYIILYNISEKQVNNGQKLLYIKKIEDIYYIGRGLISNNILKTPTDFESTDTWNDYGYFPHKRTVLLPDNAMIKLDDFYYVVKMKMKLNFNNISDTSPVITDLIQSSNIENFILKLKNKYINPDIFKSINQQIYTNQKPVYNLILDLQFIEK